MNKSINLELLYALVLFAYYEFREAEAARRLSVTVAQFRTRLRLLEDQIEVPIFERTPHGRFPGQHGPRTSINWITPTLTRAGQKLVARAVPFMATIDDLEQSVRIEHHRANLTPSAA